MLTWVIGLGSLIIYWAYSFDYEKIENLELFKNDELCYSNEISERT